MRAALEFNICCWLRKTRFLRTFIGLVEYVGILLLDCNVIDSGRETANKSIFLRSTRRIGVGFKSRPMGFRDEDLWLNCGGF